MARNNFWVIRVVRTQRGIYRSRAEANERGYRHYNEKGWADAFETEGEANEYLAQPVVSRVVLGSFGERFKRQNPILKLLIGGFVLQFFFFVLFKLSFNLDKQICGENPASIFCLEVVKFRVAVMTQMQDIIRFVSYEIIAFLSIVTYEFFNFIN